MTFEQKWSDIDGVDTYPLQSIAIFSKFNYCTEKEFNKQPHDLFQIRNTFCEKKTERNCPAFFDFVFFSARKATS